MMNSRKVALVCGDLFIVVIAGALAHFAASLFTDIQTSFKTALLISVCLVSFLITAQIFGIERQMWRNAKLRDYVLCISAISTTGVITFSCNYLFSINCVGLFLIFYYVVLICGIIMFRILFSRAFLPPEAMLQFEKKKNENESDKKRALIIGAGDCAGIILSEINSGNTEYIAVGAVDDDMTKRGMMISGTRILFGSTYDIPKIALDYKIDTIIFSIPSCEAQNRKRILDICNKTKCELKVLPYLHEMVFNNTDILSQAKDIKIEDLLGREPITFDKTNVRELVSGKVCMVTGGGGSIGSELCRQIASFSPKKLVIVDIYENNAYDIQQELEYQYGNSLDFEVHISSVRDYEKMNIIFNEVKPKIVFHAAAHKHVPLMENDPEEAVKNNVAGTFNVATLAEFYNVEKFVLISTDKAVNPTNVMGATKRCCEMIVQYMAQQSKRTEFVAVRFGNVLGSNGSVIPLFRKQIEKGGPITVTHPDIIRYFMTIPEAVSLVLQAGAMASGGEIFVLDMGAPVKIVTLAENLIRSYGKRPYIDIKIEFTGLRPGEKLFEELLMNEEGMKKTPNNKIFIGNQIDITPDVFITKLREIKTVAADNNSERVIEILSELVPTFRHKRNDSENDTTADEMRKSKQLLYNKN